MTAIQSAIGALDEGVRLGALRSSIDQAIGDLDQVTYRRFRNELVPEGNDALMRAQQHLLNAEQLNGGVVPARKNLVNPVIGSDLYRRSLYERKTAIDHAYSGVDELVRGAPSRTDAQSILRVTRDYAEEALHVVDAEIRRLGHTSVAQRTFEQLKAMESQILGLTPGGKHREHAVDYALTMVSSEQRLA